MSAGFVISRSSLASFGVLPNDVGEICFSILSKDSSLVGFLCDNSALPFTVWKSLYLSKLSVSDATNLVSRSLPEDLVDLVVRSEKRSKVLCSLIEHNSLSLENQRLIAVNNQDAPKKALLYSSYCHPSVRRFLAESVQNVPLLEEMVIDSSESFTHADRVKLVENFSDLVDSSSFREISFLLSLLFFRYPELIAHAVFSDNSSVLTAACGSIHARDEDLVKVFTAKSSEFLSDNSFALMALAANPAASLRTVELLRESIVPIKNLQQVIPVCDARIRRANDSIEFLDLCDDTAVLSVLVHRALPSEYKPQGRPLDMALLAVNPHISASDRDLLVNALGYADDRIFKVLPSRVSSKIFEYQKILNTPETGSVVSSLFSGANDRVPEFISLLQDHLDKAVDVLGNSVPAWECFLSLLDDFSGSFDDLLHVSRNM